MLASNGVRAPHDSPHTRLGLLAPSAIFASLRPLPSMRPTSSCFRRRASRVGGTAAAPTAGSAATRAKRPAKRCALRHIRGGRIGCAAGASLTRRSTGSATAASVSPACASRTIVAVRAYAVCLRRPVSSNVRRWLATTRWTRLKLVLWPPPNSRSARPMVLEYSARSTWRRVWPWREPPPSLSSGRPSFGSCFGPFPPCLRSGCA